MYSKIWRTLASFKKLSFCAKTSLHVANSNFVIWTRLQAVFTNNFQNILLIFLFVQRITSEMNYAPRYQYTGWHLVKNSTVSSPNTSQFWSRSSK